MYKWLNLEALKIKLGSIENNKNTYVLMIKFGSIEG
jgi:hypothetical protein